MTDYILDLPAGSFDYPSSNYAPWDRDTGTNRQITRHLFDDSTAEYLEAQFQVPTDVDLTASAKIRVYSYSAAATPAGNVYWVLGTCPKADNEVWDDAYTETAMPVQAYSTQDQLELTSKNVAITSLGFAADDLVRLYIKRNVITTSELTGDASLVHLRIALPRA